MKSNTRVVEIIIECFCSGGPDKVPAEVLPDECCRMVNEYRGKVQNVVLEGLVIRGRLVQCEHAGA